MYYMDDIRKWKAVYRLLDHVSTEVFDCGTLCGSACCMQQGNEEDMGIYLFPGEHLLLQESCCSRADQCKTNALATPAADPQENAPQDTAEYAGSWLKWEAIDPGELGFPESWSGPVYFVKCQTPPICPRRFRPLQCRTFPLKPVIGETGVLELIWNDEELPYTCPIIEKNMPIHDDFYKATYTVWTHLLRDPRIMDLVLQWS